MLIKEKPTKKMKCRFFFNCLFRFFTLIILRLFEAKLSHFRQEFLILVLFEPEKHVDVPYEGFKTLHNR